MASGLCLLGRGGRRWSYGTTHLAFAVVGGAATGFLLGGFGLMLPSEARAACAGAGAALAVYLAVHPSSNGSGLRRQVERRLELRLRPLRAYAVWGAELGSGWSTLI